MAKLIFIEGVSGVGKSTMVRSLAEQLNVNGCKVKSYVEFDYTNPIDFYCTAYVPLEEYEQLCCGHAVERELLEQNSVIAGDAVLVRYYDDNRPLFAGPLLSKLAQMEFCYNPTHLVPIEKYTEAYKTVWHNFVNAMDKRRITIFLTVHFCITRLTI